MTSSTSNDSNPLDRLVEEFVERQRRGEHPALSEYAARYPELADEIRDLFPVLAVVERFKPAPAELAVTPSSPDEGELGEAHGRLGDYRIVRTIGAGGMGIVYEVERESLACRVALKVMHPEFRSSASYVRRFHTEARAAARLHHTNIVGVFDFGEQDGVCYYAMQYIAGHGLDVVLDDVRRLRRANAQAAASGPGTTSQLAAALVAARSETTSEDKTASDPSRRTVTLGLMTGRYAAVPAAPAPGTEAVSAKSGSDRTGATAFSTPDEPGLDGAAGRSTIDLTAEWAAEYTAAHSSLSSLVGTNEDRYHREVARIGAQVADALAYAHRRGVLHRDIKPSNLLLDPMGNVWVTDFGLAKFAEDEDLSRSHGPAGTLRYMAPERFRGVSDPGCDVYALGATLYELLTLRPAFEGQDQLRLVDRIAHEPPVPPRRIDARIPRDLETILLKAMAKEPGDRFATALEMAEELRRFLENRPLRSRPVSLHDRLWRWCQRNPSLAGSLGAAAAALVAVALLAVLYARGQAASRNEIANVAKNLKKSLHDSESLGTKLRMSLATSNQRLAALHFERGQAAFEKGQTGLGLLWMIETWRSAFAAGDPGWQHTARANLAAWQNDHVKLKAVFSHQGGVTAVAFSPDGKAVLTGSYDQTARLWDANTGEPIGPPIMHKEAVCAVAFSPDGKTVLTGSWYKTAQLWDAATGKPIGPPMMHKEAVAAVAFSLDGKVVLTGSLDKTARLWNTATGKPIGPPMEHKGFVVAVAFSPDGKAVLTGSYDHTAQLWDATTGSPIGPSMVHQAAVLAVAFSPDGRAALIHSNDGTGRWDVATGKPIGPLMAHQNRDGAAAFSPDGKAVLTGSRYHMARLWDAATGGPIGPPMAHQAPVLAVAFSPDGRTILTGSLDDSARLWDAITSKPIGPTLVHRDVIGAVAFSPEGPAVLTGGHTAQLWDSATGKPSGPPLVHRKSILAVAFSPNGNVVATGSHDTTARLWDTATGKPIGSPMAHEQAIFGVVFSADGKVVVTRGGVTARLWDAATGTSIAPPMVHKYVVGAVAISPDGKTVITGSESARLWDATTGKPIGAPMVHKNAVVAVAFSPIGKTVITGSRDHTARLWDAATGMPRGPSMEHADQVSSVAFSPDGKTVITGSWDHMARLWDAATGKPVGPPLEHTDKVTAVAFSPDGNAVLTGSDDKTARLWDAATGKPIGPPLDHQAAVAAVAFSPDGKAVVTDSSDMTARIWTIRELPDDLPRLTTWIELITGLELDEQGSIRTLDNAAWQQRRMRLDRQGGPPETDRR